MSEKIGQLKMESNDGKKYLTDCADTETAFRIIQSIPSPKAEPFKRWLAKVGYERVQEVENPELATKRTRLLYEYDKIYGVWSPFLKGVSPPRVEGRGMYEDAHTSSPHRLWCGEVSLKGESKCIFASVAKFTIKLSIPIF